MLDTPPMNSRVYNFSPGPAILPESVLARVAESVVNHGGSGIGIMELSHRSKQFMEIIESTEERLRRLLGLDDSYAVLFATGGATNQFSMLALNLLRDGMEGNYILSGSWAEKAYEEASRFGRTHIAGSTKQSNYNAIPSALKLSDNPAYLHFTSNNTIYGTQFAEEPSIAASIPLICDASSDFLHRPLDTSRYSMIYAGAQKNLGPAGVTLVVIKRELIGKHKREIPLMLDYATYLNSKSLHNTPPTLPIFVVGEVLSWIESQGGLLAMERLAWERASKVYAVIDESDFYQGLAEPESRSLMNITFKLADSSREEAFLKEAEAEQLVGLRGYRSLGGMRASMYNAFPVEGANRLADYMRQFAARA